MPINRPIARPIARNIASSIEGVTGDAGRFFSIFGGNHIELGELLAPATADFRVRFTIRPAAGDVGANTTILSQHTLANPRFLTSGTDALRIIYVNITAGTITLNSTTDIQSGVEMVVEFISDSVTGTRLLINGVEQDDSTGVVDHTIFALDMIGSRHDHGFNFQGEIYDVVIPDGSEYVTYAVDEASGLDVVASPVSGSKNGTWTALPEFIQRGVGFSPTQISQIGWYDPSDTSTITESSGFVSQLDDLSIYQQHLGQSTGSAQPETGTRTQNGLNVLDYDGLDDFLDHAGFAMPASGNVAFYLVAKPEIVDFFAALFACDAASHDFQLQAQSATEFLGRISVSNLGDVVDYTGGPFPGPSVYTIVFDRDGSTVTGYVDGISRGSGAYTANIGLVQNLLLFKARGGVVVGGPAGEFLITEDLSRRLEIEQYLANKWGL